MTEHPQNIDDLSHDLSGISREIVENDKIIQQYDEQYLQPASAPPLPWQQCGSVVTQQAIENGLLLVCENAFMELRWFAPKILRVRVQPESNDFSGYFSYYVDPNLNEQAVDLRIRESNEQINILAGDQHYSIDKATSRITCYDEDNQPIFAMADSASWREDRQVSITARLHPFEASYGTGERAFNLNLRGRRLPIWNTDPGGYHRGDDPVNYCVSYYLGVHAHGAYGLLWDNPARGVFDIGAAEPEKLHITAETGTLSYYLFAGKDVNDVMAQYTLITGRMPLPPLWALGYQQNRYSYESEVETLEVAQKLRELQIPCDAIYLDIHYMDEFRIFTWNQETFNNLHGLVDNLHAIGMKIVTIMDPGVQVKEGYAGYDTGIEEGIFITYPDGKPAAGVVWPGLCHFPDFSNPKARDWWKEQLAPLLQTGIDGLWNDMNEPLIFKYEELPGFLPDYTLQDKEGRGGTHLELHNVYGMLMGQASKAALDEQRPGKRQFNIIRAGAAGAQRDSLAWSGDNHSTWDQLHLAISMCIQLGLSGISFTGADVGGFGSDTTGELLTRWTQAGALLPLFRNHSAYGTVRQEPWSFGEPYTDAIRKAIELRYQLLPYIYTAFALNSFEGQPIIRPIFTAEPHNPHLRDMDDCYLVGDKLLVAPALHPHTLRRSVYLPEGDWHDFHTHERYEGGQIITVDAPLDRLPLFVKSGTVLPMWPVMQYTGEKAVETLILRIYTDTGDTTLYEDSGEGLDYQDGEYRWVQFHMFETANSLTIERSADGAYTPPYTRIELQLVGTWQEIDQIEADGIMLDEWHTENGMVIAQVDGDFDTLHISTSEA